MRVIKTEKTVYKFDELTENVQQKVIEKLYDINVDYDWWEFVYEDATQIGKIIGIEIDKIYFSGFYSQGDGACFEGRYSYEKDSVKKLKEYAPLDKNLHDIAIGLYSLQRSCFYTATAKIKHNGHYYHKYCTDIDCYFDSHFSYHDFFTREREDTLKELLRDFMDWIYRRLEQGYEYQTSKDSITETIRANEYEFDENGNIA